MSVFFVFLSKFKSIWFDFLKSENHIFGWGSRLRFISLNFLESKQILSLGSSIRFFQHDMMPNSEARA
jgi:hypothetical protein